MLFALFHTLQTEKGWDFLTIYDGANDYSDIIEKLSGNLGSFGRSSSGNAMFVKFESDVAISDKGFLATFNYGKINRNVIQIDGFFNTVIFLFLKLIAQMS